MFVARLIRFCTLPGSCVAKVVVSRVSNRCSPFFPNISINLVAAFGVKSPAPTIVVIATSRLNLFVPAALSKNTAVNGSFLNLSFTCCFNDAKNAA